MKAAAFALDLIQAGTITARGPLGHLLTPEPHQDVYAGDPLEPAREARVILHRSWEEARADAEAWFQAARADPPWPARSWAPSPAAAGPGRSTTASATP